MKALKALFGMRQHMQPKRTYGSMMLDGGDLPLPELPLEAPKVRPVPGRKSKVVGHVTGRDYFEAARKAENTEAENTGAERELSLTSSQQTAMQELEVRARLFFNPTPACSKGIPIQLNSLMIGPTGCGKTIVAEILASRLKAKFVTCTYSSWIPEGAEEGNPTVRHLVQSACSAQRVVLFVDELDKFFAVRDQHSWGASVLNDLWLVLDRSLSWQGLVDKQDFRALLPEGLRSADKLKQAFRSRIFIVAAGTWQTAYRPSKALGFGGNAESHDVPPLEGILKRGELPEEVLRRFNRDVLTLTYPDEAELLDLLERDQWLWAYARKSGTPIDAPSLRKEMNTVGMTALTSLKTRLTLKSMRGGR